MKNKNLKKANVLKESLQKRMGSDCRFLYSECKNEKGQDVLEIVIRMLYGPLSVLPGPVITVVVDDVRNIRESVDQIIYNDMQYYREYVLNNVFFVMHDRSDTKYLKFLHEPFLDMAAVYHIDSGDDEECYHSICFDKTLVNALKISYKELYDAALRNTKGTGSFYTDISDMSKEVMTSKEIPKSELFILTNETGTLGASLILYPEIFQEISEVVGNDFRILPVSQHEIAISTNLAMKPKYLQKVVATINDVILEEDLLTDSVYRYRKDSNKIEIELSGEDNRAMEIAGMLSGMFR